jgi:hypothetical protein
VGRLGIVSVNWVRANPKARVQGLVPSETKTNYLVGNNPRSWRTNIENYTKIAYTDLYRGVDLIYYGKQHQLEYDLVFTPGTDPDIVEMHINGAEINLNSQGDLILKNQYGTMVQLKPRAYQEYDHSKKVVDVRYSIRGRRIGFAVTGYDRSKPLIIDPVWTYSEYFGGTVASQAFATATDGSGCIYITGTSGQYLQSGTFPTTTGSFQQTLQYGYIHGFVSKLSSDGSSFVYSTYLGGSSEDKAYGIAVDGSGNAYITGYTSSADFPVTPGVIQTTYPGSQNSSAVFVTKLAPAGDHLIYSTWLGGANNDQGNGIAVDLAGNAYIVGSAASPSFPVTPGVFQSSSRGGMQAFISKLNPAGTALVFSTLLGGTMQTHGTAVTIDSSSNIYVTGRTYGGFPTTPGSLQPTSSDDYIEKAFVSKISSDGSQLLYSTYLGGTGTSGGTGIAVDGSGNAYTTGYTDDLGFPVTAGAYLSQYPSLSPTSAIFVSKLNPTGSGLVYSTYIGASHTDGFVTGQSSIVIDPSGTAYLGGETQSSAFPVTPDAFFSSNPFPSAYGELMSGYFSILSADGSALSYSSYWAAAAGMAMDTHGYVYLAGYATGAYGYSVVTLAKINVGTPPVQSSRTVHIDSPVTGTMVTGAVAVSGWALDNISTVGSAIGSVQVLVDGVVAGSATYGVSRPDVCTAYPGRPGCPDVGFTYQLNTTSLGSGPHTIAVSATDTDGTPDTGTASVTVIVTGVPPTVHIDGPVAGSVLSGSVTISGWAVDNTSAVGTAISGVQVKVDGTTVGNATYGVSRPDVCTAYPGRVGCPNVGFSYSLNLASLSAGPHAITVSATDSDGTPDVGTASVTITVANGPPTVYIDSPAPGTVVSGTVTVSGWALDNISAIGTAINNVLVKVDGTTVGTANYGVSRPDVCSAYSGRPGCPNVGFTYALNTTTLSPGSHLLTVTATDSDASPDSASWSLTIQIAAPPSVVIDLPAAGSTISGMVTVAGWAIDNVTAVGTAISSVQVKVDGVVVGTALYGVARPDVCAVYAGRPGCPNVGYSYALNAASLTPGTHTITVSATDTDGTPDVGSATITVTAAAVPPSVHVDSPTAGAVVSGTVTVAGWAIDNATSVGMAISSVQVNIDGVLVGTASYGVSRPDVCAAYAGRVGCPNVGFSYALNTATLTPGTHTITVMATDSDGTPDTGSSSVTITVTAAPPSVHIDAPAGGAMVSGVVTVAGWAIDNVTAVGTAISSVQVLVDGTTVGTATYSIARPDVCAVYPGRAGCPNVGFTYQFNTAALAAGTHTLTVTATDSDGNPDAGSASITIIR